MSGRKKPLSFEDKKKKMLEYFYETKDFWQLKELEKHLPKQKGIVSQSVKEVLELLVAENLVQMEKIGTSNYFWSFPSTAGQIRKRQFQDLQTEINSLEEKKEKLEQDIESMKSVRIESKERSNLLVIYNEQEAKKKKVLGELQQFKDCDPVMLEKKEQFAKQCIQHANRWTENIMAVRQYCVRKFNMDPKAFNKSFRIADDFDLIDE